MSQIWDRVLQLAGERISKPSLETWLNTTQLIEIHEDRKQAEVSAQNEFARDWLDTRYKVFLEGLLYEVTNKKYSITFNHIESSIDTSADTLSLPLNKNMTLHNFSLVSTGQKFAYTAALSVASSPGTAYNPLIICGPKGAGKTHLLHAIANKIRDDYPSKSILLVTAEHFLSLMNQPFSSGIKTLEKTIQKSDALLIDDLHMLVDNTEAEYILFNLFNYLFSEKKQMVFTLNERPSKQSISEKLRSRFEWGLTVDLPTAEEKDVGGNDIQDNQKELQQKQQVELATDTTTDLLQKLLIEQKRTNELLNKLLEEQQK